MLEVIQKNPEAAVSIINYLSHRLRESQDNAKAFALDRAEQRVAAILTNLAERSGIRDDQGLRISVRLTHQDLADMAGLTKETTSRILSRFKKDQFISGHGKHLHILNLSRLQEMAPHALQ